MVAVLFISLSDPCRAEVQEIPAVESIPSLIQSVQFDGDIRFCGEPVPYHRRDVREALEKEVLLALWNRPQVILWLKRGSKFFPHIEGILKEENLPLDLKYVPIIESAMRPHARSSAGAVGYWQFLRSTGRQNGLKVNKELDERRNIFKSTKAACRYIKKLHGMTGSYAAALAGYNMGEYGLSAEIKTQKTGDYFSLYLPLETQRYVYKVIAAKLIMEAPEHHGFYMKKADYYPLFSFSRLEFNSKKTLPLQLISDAANISFKTLKEWNPDVRGYYLPRGKMALLVPQGKEKGFQKRFEQLFKDWNKKNQPRFHRVRSGETLSGIADKYGVSLGKLLRLNRFSVKKVIHPGDRLVVR
ncbi:MAG: transglycosylase SLT domain-containing protein [Desulfobacterales bacterium]|nr:transglycosylase SLT domain-containing protein [Desulfobacterales bacterium]